MVPVSDNERSAQDDVSEANSSAQNDKPASFEHSAAERDYASEAYADPLPESDPESASLQEGGCNDATPHEYDDDYEARFDEDDEAEEISLRGKRVMLIEDDDEFTEGITEYLIELGIEKVILAKNAEAALSLLTDRETFPHIILLELALVGMDGIRFLAQLRASSNKRLQTLPAVVITMLDNPSIYRRAANQKVGAFLRKPVAISALRDGLQAALRGDIVEKPFSRPKSWLDDVDEQDLRAKSEANIAKAAAKAQKQGFLVRFLSALIPWSGRT